MTESKFLLRQLATLNKTNLNHIVILFWWRGKVLLFDDCCDVVGSVKRDWWCLKISLLYYHQLIRCFAYVYRLSGFNVSI